MCVFACLCLRERWREQVNEINKKEKRNQSLWTKEHSLYYALSGEEVGLPAEGETCRLNLAIQFCCFNVECELPAIPGRISCIQDCFWVGHMETTVADCPIALCSLLSPAPMRQILQ